MAVPALDETRPHLRGFAAHYERAIRPALAPLERARRNALWQFWTILGVGVPLLAWWVFDFLLRALAIEVPKTAGWAPETAAWLDAMVWLSGFITGGAPLLRLHEMMLFAAAAAGGWCGSHCGAMAGWRSASSGC